MARDRSDMFDPEDPGGVPAGPFVDDVGVLRGTDELQKRDGDGWTPLSVESAGLPAGGPGVLTRAAPGGTATWEDVPSGGGLDEEAVQEIVDDSIATKADAAATTTALNGKVAKAGDTLTGPLVLHADPTQAMHAATRQYVLAIRDALVNGAPGQLDTLQELAAALADDDSAIAALTTAVGGKQAADPRLAAIVGATWAANQLLYLTGTGTVGTSGLTAAGRALLDDADASAQLSTLGVSTFIKTLLDDADPSSARTTLGAAAAADLTAHTGSSLLHPQQLGRTENANSFTTTSATGVDITGQSMTKTIGARPVRGWYFSPNIQSTTSSDVVGIQIVRGSTVVGGALCTALGIPVVVPIYDNPAAGSYTYKAQLYRFAGAGTAQAVGLGSPFNAPQAFWLEEVAA